MCACYVFACFFVKKFDKKKREPPAIIPAPVTLSLKATENCVAIQAPLDTPETVTS